MYDLDHAEQLFQSANYLKALELYSTLAKDVASNAFVHQRIGQCYYQLGEYEQAVTASNAALRLDPGLAIPHTILASVYGRSGNLEKSRDEALAALALEPNTFEVIDMYGATLLADGRTSEAEQMLQKAAGLRPNSFRTHENLAVAYARSRKPKKYLVEAGTLFRLKPSPLNGLRLLMAFQAQYVVPITILVVGMIFLSMALRLAILLIIPGLYAFWATANVYGLAKERRWRNALSYLILTILYWVLLYVAYKAATHQ